jgi:hypothetical protein
VPDFGMAGRNGRAYVWFPIGHQLLMVPCVAAGEALARAMPAPERHLFELKGGSEEFGRFFWSRLLVSFLPVPFAAGSVLLVFLLALRLQCTARGALLVAGVATLCTQFWPGSSETTSDVPGAFFLLAMAERVFAHRAASGSPRSDRRRLLVAGLCGGMAVLVRYPHAAPALVLALGAAHTAYHRGRLGDVAWLAAGAAPAAGALLYSNWARFGSLLETGYSAGATSTWFGYPLHWGVPFILAAPGKGILWFSPPIWIAAWAMLRRAATWPGLMAWPALLVPLLVFGRAGGWAAGQCWGIRYFTAAVVLLVTVGLSVARPWERMPRRFALVCGLGLAVSLGGVLTPYRGDRYLAHVATGALYPAAAERDRAEIFNVLPRFTPLMSHWGYAWLSLTGRLEAGGSRNTTEPLFGVSVPGPLGEEVRPTQAEDRGFRHVWPRYLHAFFGVPAAIGWAWLALTTLLLGGGLAGILRADRGTSRRA